MSSLGLLTACTVLFSCVIILLLNTLRQRITRIEEGLAALTLREGAAATQPQARKPAQPALEAGSGLPIQNRGAVVAAIATALAEEIGEPIEGLRILSLRALGQSAQPAVDRGEVVAAVAAVIAQDLGTDIQSIRVLSFQQV